MTTQIIKVYYGQDALPYKDRERTVHFPITGSTFVGSSDTTKIRFYVDGYLGNDSALWISVSKRADNTQGSQFLTSGTDENGDKYREMTLSGWYTELKGDLYISLKGYQGGSTGYWDEDTGMYVVEGVPVIRATGSIKLAINYAPIGEYPNYEDDMANFQDIVAQVGEKLNITSGIVVVDNIALESATTYEEGQLIYNKLDKTLYIVSGESFVSFFTTYSKSEIDTTVNGLSGRIDASGHTLSASINNSTYEMTFVLKDKNGNSISTQTIDLPLESIVTSATYYDSYEYDGTTYEKVIVIVLSTTSVPTIVPVGDLVSGLVSTSDLETALGNYVEKSSNDTCVYVNDEYGEPTTITLVQNIATPNTIPLRTNDGDLIVPSNPSTSGSATSKSYVDSGLSSKQNTLVNQQNIKSINGNSLLGSGDLTISTGGGTWGSITGNISDQTDLNNELTNIREVAEGKCKTLVISYQATAPTSDLIAVGYRKPDGTYFTDLADFNDYVSGYTLANSDFNSQNNYLELLQSASPYIITVDLVVYKYSDLRSAFKKGDILLITETVDSNGDNLPDRWFYPSLGEIIFWKLETGKIDLSNYATKTDLSTALTNLAGVYDDTLTYTVGEIVIHDNKLYRCTTAITQAEDWDSTHWESTSVASDFVNLTGTQVITGNKTFSGQAIFSSYVGGDLRPRYNASSDIGSTLNKWKDLYLSGKIYTETVESPTSELTFRTGSATRFVIANASIKTRLLIRPETGYNGVDIGDSTNQFRNGYFSGQVYAQNTFNIIDASNIVSQTLTQEQYDLITNGKPTLISGDLVINSQKYSNLFIDHLVEKTSTYWFVAIVGSQQRNLQIDKTSKVISQVSNYGYSINENGSRTLQISQLNGKSVPAYPANTGTFVLKCVDGVLTWVAE